MYLNWLAEPWEDTKLRLALTWDVFKCLSPPSIPKIGVGLALTWDVFKWRRSFPTIAKCRD